MHTKCMLFYLLMVNCVSIALTFIETGILLRAALLESANGGCLEVVKHL